MVSRAPDDGHMEGSHSLLLCEISRRSQYNYDGVVLELDVAITEPLLARVIAPSLQI